MAAGDTFQGQRMRDGDPFHWPRGGYGIWDGRWYGKTPAEPDPALGVIGGVTAALGNHDVTEHKDGTITVSPSISVSTRRDDRDIELYHGYLERGVWREV